MVVSFSFPELQHDSHAVADVHDRTWCLALTACFFVVYAMQVPWITSIADVWVYSLRADAQWPLVAYPFLEVSTAEPVLQLYNYHLGHTLILWLTYHVVPQSLAHSIWPSGMLSAISMAVSVGLTFLICRRVGLDQRSGFIVAVVSGVIPSFWYMALVGEVYALQHAFTLAFVYAFMTNRTGLSAVMFLLAVLVSPLAGLSFTLLLLAPWTWQSMRRAIVVGSSALLAYILIFILLDSNVMTLFESESMTSIERSRLWLFGKLVAIVLINIGCFLLMFARGCTLINKRHQRLGVVLMISMVPQFLISILDATFLRGMGCFQLMMLWLLTLPIGMAVARSQRCWLSLAVPALGTLILTFVVWIVPANQVAESRQQAGEWLKEQRSARNAKLIGGWNDGVGIAVALHGWDIDAITHNLRYVYRPTTADILALNEREVYIIARNRHVLRERLTVVPVESLNINNYLPEQTIRQGSIEKVFENMAVRIYRWRASSSS